MMDQPLKNNGGTLVLMWSGQLSPECQRDVLQHSSSKRIKTAGITSLYVCHVQRVRLGLGNLVK